VIGDMVHQIYSREVRLVEHMGKEPPLEYLL